MSENYYCVVEENICGDKHYFKHQLCDGDCEFFITDLISKPKGLKTKYISFNYLHQSGNRNDPSAEVYLHIRKDVFYDDNIIDLEPVIVIKTSRSKGLHVKTEKREVHLKINSLVLPEKVTPNIIVLDQNNLDVMKNILSEERYSRLALEVELQGGINL